MDFCIKYLILRHRALTMLACALPAATMFALVNTPTVTKASAIDRQLSIYCVRRDRKMLATSLDAAWDNESTQQFIDILERYNVKTTFFVVGGWVDKYPESIKAPYDADREATNYSNSHAHMSQLSSEAIVADVEACSGKIETITGVYPTLIHPPYGKYGNSIITSIRSIGMESTQWDADGLDWKDLPTEETTEWVMSQAQPRSIVLFYNIAPRTPEALPIILEALLQEGYTSTPISRLIFPEEYDVDYTIDHTGRQLPAQSSSSPR